MYWMVLHRPVELAALIRHWVHKGVGNPVTNSELEVRRFPISAKVGGYSCRTTLKREVLMWIPPL
jgi:hypothetical protein